MNAEPMDFETFAGRRGAGHSDLGDAALHRSSSNVSKRARKAQLDRALQQQQDWARQRAALREEYDSLVAQGVLRPPTHDEQLIQAARGHEDHPSTQAARRVLARRGIDWSDGLIVNETSIERGK